MPSIGNLCCPWQRLLHRLSVAAATITRDNPDLPVIVQAGSDGGNLPVWQELHDPSTLKAQTIEP